MSKEINPPPSLPEDSHPYSVNVSLRLGSDVELDLPDSDVRLPFTEDTTLRIVKKDANHQEQALSITRMAVLLEAFPSACEAERAGKLLILSILWVAASKRVTVEFEKRTGAYPFAVLDRTRSEGPSMRGSGRTFHVMKPEEFSSIAGEAFELGKEAGPQIITSMEFYASANMEYTERSRFIGLMTALEALAVQCDYGDEVALVLKDLALQLETCPSLEGDDKKVLRSSLAGRIRNLREESVRQAILRVVKQYIDDEDTVGFIDKAYGVRSKILHEGLQATQLHQMTYRLEDTMRQIYSTILGQRLSRPPLQS